MTLILLFAIAGFALIFLEFFLPGMIFAIAGSAALLGSIALFFVSYSAIWGLFYVFCLLIVLMALCKTTVWWIGKTKKNDQLYLDNNQEGYVASQFDRGAIGKKGVAFTELKPAGHILIEGKQQQAVCETGYASQGTHIEVVGGKGGYLLVREIINKGD